MQRAVIVSSCRTPIGSFQGSLASVPAPRLGSIVIREAVRRAGIPATDVTQVIMGCVLPAGQGQAPARQAALGAGLPNTTEALTINKMCGSGLKSVMLASQAIACGDTDVVVAGGMESMSNAPYLLPKGRSGYRMGHGQVIDSMISDGLWDVYHDYHMGTAAELCAREFSISRKDQDDFALLSYTRAQGAVNGGTLRTEIVPVELTGKKKETTAVTDDEEPFRADFDRIPQLRPAFQNDGTVTAANASKINDGASALVVMSEEAAARYGRKPLARIVGSVSTAREPEWFTIAPVDAIRLLLQKTGRSLSDIDLFEVNEAFAVVALAVQRQLGIATERLNINGGAIAYGHPIGASGARILTTLLTSMQERNAATGIAAICIGGGEASALLVERI